jgi:hypothetical protein
MARLADIARDSGRDFLGSHPWIRFELDLQGAPWPFWEQIGEARSKCQQIAKTPLPPDVSRELSSLYLAKGGRATTAIEGNTLREEQALAAVRGQLQLPVSQEYQRREIENILAACAAIEREVREAGKFAITPRSGPRAGGRLHGCCDELRLIGPAGSRSDEGGEMKRAKWRLARLRTALFGDGPQLLGRLQILLRGCFPVSDGLGLLARRRQVGNELPLMWRTTRWRNCSESFTSRTTRWASRS